MKVEWEANIQILLFTKLKVTTKAPHLCKQKVLSFVILSNSNVPNKSEAMS